MPLLPIIAAALASFAFGAVWYTLLARRWMAVSGVPLVDDAPANRSDPIPYLISLVGSVTAAAVLWNLFVASGIEAPLRGLLTGLAVGLFLVSPWIATCYGFAARPRMLTLIDCGYATFGCGVMGLVLTLF